MKIYPLFLRYHPEKGRGKLGVICLTAAKGKRRRLYLVEYKGLTKSINKSGEESIVWDREAKTTVVKTKKNQICKTHTIELHVSIEV